MRFRISAQLLVFVIAVSSGCAGLREDADSLQESGVMHRNAREYDQAIADFNRAIATAPNMASAYVNRGFVYVLTKRYDKAIQDYNKAIALRPRYATAYNGRGLAYQLVGNYPRAIESYDQALKINPNLVIALKNRGRAQFLIGNFAQAAADLDAGSAFDTANVFVALWLHIAKARAGIPDTAELAARVARTDTTRWPAPVAKLYLGKIDLRQFASAVAIGDSTAKAHQRCGEGFYVGEYLLARHDTVQAIAGFKRAQSMCEKDAVEYQGAVAELARLRAA